MVQKYLALVECRASTAFVQGVQASTTLSSVFGDHPPIVPPSAFKLGKSLSPSRCLPRWGGSKRIDHAGLIMKIINTLCCVSCWQAVPGRFWDLHRKRLQCNDLQLRGPNKAICVVKAQRIYDLEEEKLIVCLDSGWEAFRVANQFQVGDILEFFLVANSCFTVDLVQRMAKN